MGSTEMNAIQLTDIDRRIVTTLAERGQLPYKELADQVGIPVSTCHGRVRALEERGVIRGYRVDIDPDALGLSVSALILVRVQGHQRDRVPDIAGELRRIPGVQQVFLIGGERDMVVHVACENVPALRNLLAEHFGSNAALAQTQTQIVFDHLSGLAPVRSHSA